MSGTTVQQPLLPGPHDARTASGEPVPRRSLLRHSASFGLFSAFAYGFSLLKTLVVTHLFGTNAAMDAYTIALLVPSLLGTLLIGAAGAGLVPALAIAERGGGEPRAQLFRNLLWVAGAAGVLGAIALAIWAEPVIRIVGFGLDPVRREVAIPLLRVLAWLMVFNAVFAMASAELLGRRRFAITAAAPAVSVIFSLLIIVQFSHLGIQVLAYALLAGTAVQAAVVLVPALRMNRIPDGRRGWSPALAPALRAQLPLLLASGLGVANVSVDQAIAGLLPAGAVSALSYGSTINGILAQCAIMSLGWVALPEFSSLYAAGERTALLERVRECIRTVVLLVAPLTVLVIATGATVLRITFQHGAFTAESTDLVYKVWAGYALGLVPFSVGVIGARMANAIHEQPLLAKIAAAMLPVNALLDYLLMRKLGIFGISLSTTLVYCVSMVLVLVALHRKLGERILDRGTVAHVGRTIGVCSISALVFLPVRYMAGHVSAAVILAGVANVALVLFLYSRLRLMSLSTAVAPPASS